MLETGDIGAVAAEEGKVAVSPRAWAEPLGTWGAWQKEQQPWRPPRLEEARLLRGCLKCCLSAAEVLRLSGVIHVGGPDVLHGRTQPVPRAR